MYMQCFLTDTMPLTAPIPLAASTLTFPLYLSRVQAGFPSPCEDHIEASLSLDELCIAHPSSTYLARIQGDSLRDLGIFEGDIAVVDRSLEPRQGQVVVAVVNGEFTAKVLMFEGGQPVLRAANEAYPDIRLGEGEALELFGVVTSIVRTGLGL
ncbi:MAG: Protein UmuD [Pseudomonas citronellolis]|nr:MAG: Protein UmuD [Pseudomonas citronellolis]